DGVSGSDAQAALDLWREQFNDDRPHEARQCALRASSICLPHASITAHPKLWNTPTWAVARSMVAAKSIGKMNATSSVGAWPGGMSVCKAQAKELTSGLGESCSARSILPAQTFFGRISARKKRWKQMKTTNRM